MALTLHFETREVLPDPFLRSRTGKRPTTPAEAAPRHFLSAAHHCHLVPCYLDSCACFVDSLVTVLLGLQYNRRCPRLRFVASWEAATAEQKPPKATIYSVRVERFPAPGKHEVELFIPLQSLTFKLSCRQLVLLEV